METPRSNDGSKKSIELRSPVALKHLATSLGRTPVQIVGDLLDIRVVAGVDQAISFDIAAEVAKKYGFDAKRIG